MKQTVITTINQIQIIVLEDDGRWVPIKPICEAMGIRHSTQLGKIKADPILSKALRLKRKVAKDGKRHYMSCLPAKWALGWLFTISPKNVRNISRDRVIAMKLECYTCLIKHLTREPACVVDQPRFN